MTQPPRGVNRIWVVEMRLTSGRWEPTVGLGLTRAEGQLMRRMWKRDNPDDRFRLVVYWAER